MIPLKADAGKNEPHRDGRKDEPGKTQVEERHHVLHVYGRDGGLIQRQHTDVVKINHHQSHEQEKLGPLRGVAKEALHVLHHQSPRSGMEGVK